MILSDWSTKMMLLCRPMISQIREVSTLSPRSFTVSKTMRSTRSRPCCRAAMSLPEPRCLRSSIQNIGAALGFSSAWVVKWTLGAVASAERRSRRFWPLPRRVRSTSSRPGWLILSMRAPARALISWLILWRKPPSKGMGNATFRCRMGERPLGVLSLVYHLFPGWANWGAAGGGAEAVIYESLCAFSAILLSVQWRANHQNKVFGAGRPEGPAALAVVKRPRANRV